MVYIGFDVGGTGVQVGVVNEKGEILCKGNMVTRTDIPFEDQVKAMADCALETLAKNTGKTVRFVRREVQKMIGDYQKQHSNQ